MAIKMRHCWFCGDELGEIEDRHYQRTDTCGKRECERALREEFEAEREERHREVDRDFGFDRW